jgi:RNA polymerase sigma-70 factor (ECF subfamily)
MYLRKGRLSEVSLDDTLDPTQETGAQRDYGIEDLSLSGSIDRITLERAIESLPPGCRITFVLHDIEGYEHNEIAEVLGCSVGNSKSQLHKARIKLRGVLYESRALHTARTDNAQQGTPQTGTIRSLEIPTGRQNRAAASAA